MFYPPLRPGGIEELVQYASTLDVSQPKAITEFPSVPFIISVIFFVVQVDKIVASGKPKEIFYERMF